ncbi:aldo/keto reductase [Methylobacillus caricis]|uniref:aldo/keto reductase n=1 Tax=Methylobacillus caricis TaxID=1971611 RepID=UPI001CFFFFB0|nr:aldo/keto reductase [Methylobacillus caricis]MCB5188891.1 aldo/keto reductase [Methylobacillus caricis]
MNYKNFGRGTGLRVSELVLGCGTFGTRWGYGAEPGEALAMFNLYADHGGNFIDTADSYQVGQSEELIGEFLAGRRNEFVLASKYTLGGPGKGATGTGNSRQVMVASLEASLKRLKTDRIDLYWVHMPDGLTASEEIMRAMDDLVSAGKVNYIGLSDFPAWRVARAATIAEIRGWAPVIAIQMEYSLIERTPDRELIPMAEALGLGMVGWSPLAGGLLTGKYRRGEEGRATTFKRLIHAEDDVRKKGIVDVLLEIAAELAVTPGEVALAWMSSRGVLPIIGPRTREQLAENLAATEISLNDSQLTRLTAASAIPLGFPHDFLSDPAQRTRLTGGQPEQVAPLTPIA